MFFSGISDEAGKDLATQILTRFIGNSRKKHRLPSIQSFRKRFTKRPDLITNTTIRREPLFFSFCTFCERWRIIETDMHHAGITRKYRTGFVRVTTHSDNHIQMRVCELIEVLRLVTRNIHPGFVHHPYGIRIHPVRIHTGRKRLNDVSFQMTGPTLSHLTPTGIAGTQK